MVDLGVELSIDDFGTGYSSLTYLKKFPVGTLKIDKSFTRDIPDDRDDATRAGAIIQMAHALGRKTVVEGVENEVQYGFFRAERCDIAQDYFFSPPLPGDQISGLLEQSDIAQRAGPHSV